MDRSALLVLICCITTSLADSGTFNGAFVGSVILVTLLLSIIVAVAVFLLIVWIRWQKKEEGIKTANTTINGGGDIHLESEYTANSKREEANTEIECKIHIEPEEQFSEPIQSPPVYATVQKKSALRAPSPANSFTSDVDENQYSNFGGNVRMPGVGDDDMLPKPSRPAPVAPECTTPDTVIEKSDDQKPARRAPPPKPVIWGENDTQATASSFNHTKEEVKEQASPQIAHQRRTPPPKPTKWGQEEPEPTANSFHPSPVLPQITPAAVKLRPVPPTKVRPTGPPEPPTKPTSSGPPTPPVKPSASGPPTPPANKPHFNIPSAPVTKKHTNGPPPTPPVKPHPFTATPDTKPKPKPKPVGGIGTSNSDDPSISQQNVLRKPKLKPPIPTKPLSPGGKFGDEHTYSNTGQSGATGREE